jgi:hypothetical protein
MRDEKVLGEVKHLYLGDKLNFVGVLPCPHMNLSVRNAINLSR